MDREIEHENRDRNADVASGGYPFFMNCVGIQALEDRLGEFVRLAPACETVLVADRDELAAELAAPRPDRARAIADGERARALGFEVLEP